MMCDSASSIDCACPGYGNTWIADIQQPQPSQDTVLFNHGAGVGRRRGVQVISQLSRGCLVGGASCH
jgi:hypothetical protein